MATATRSRSNDSRLSPSAASPVGGGGILANAHEAPKKPIKAPDSSFASAIKSAFIPQQAGKQIKTNGKPLGKSFERKQPLATRGHEGGEVLKRDPRGDNAPCGDGIVLSTGSDDDEGEGEGESGVEAEVGAGGVNASEEDTPWSPISTMSSSLTPSSAGEASQDGLWDLATRGRSNTTTTDSMTRSASRTSEASSSNPCSIKFAPLPSSGRLKRANSITIGVAARSQLLHSQGSGRSHNNTAAWQAQFNAQRYGAPQQNEQSHGAASSQRPGGPPRAVDDTVDLGEEIRKGALKAWRRMRRGSSTSSGSAADGTTTASGGNVAAGIDSVEEEETNEIGGGEKTPKRSHSPIRMSRDDGTEEPEGTRTPRHSMQRRLSTGTFIGNNAFMEIEERRKRESRADEAGADEVDADDGGIRREREENAQFAEALGRTHASRVAHRTGNQKWHPGMGLHADGDGKVTSVEKVDGMTSVEEVFHDAQHGGATDDDDDNNNDDDDEETRLAERMADEALASHSKEATKAGAVEKMERKHG